MNLLQIDKKTSGIHITERSFASTFLKGKVYRRFLTEIKCVNKDS